MTQVMQVNDDGEGMTNVELGTVTVTSAGDGLWGMQAGRTMTVALCMQIEYEPDGDVKRYGSAQVTGTYETDEEDEALAYTDTAVEKGVNDYLQERYGVIEAVGWSEQGMQDSGYMHFDVGSELVKLAMPDLKAYDYEGDE